MSGGLTDLVNENDSEHRHVMFINDTVAPDSYQITFGVVFLFLLCFGLFFNAAVIHTFRLTTSLHTPTNVLIMGIVASDTTMVLIGLPFVIASSFHGSWMFGSAWCEGYGFVTALLGVSTICILTAVAMDRYFVVTQSPFAAKITTFKAVMTILTCYGYGLLWATFPLVGWGQYTVEPSLISCGPHWANDSASSLSYSVSIFVLVFFVPVCIILFCYVQIFLTVRGNKIGPNEQMSRARMIETRVAFSVFLVITSFIAAWSPYAVMSFWTMFNDVDQLNPSIALIAPLLAKSASVWNPLVYVARNKEFWKSLIDKTFRSVWRNRNPGNSDRQRTIVEVQNSSRNVSTTQRVTQC